MSLNKENLIFINSKHFALLLSSSAFILFCFYFSTFTLYLFCFYWLWFSAFIFFALTFMFFSFHLGLLLLLVTLFCFHLFCFNFQVFKLFHLGLLTQIWRKLETVNATLAVPDDHNWLLNMFNINNDQYLTRGHGEENQGLSPMTNIGSLMSLTSHFGLSKGN